MNSNYDGSSVGQKNAEYGALDELYCLWDAATDPKAEGDTHRPGRLRKIVVLCAISALIMTVVMLSWGLL